MIIRDFVETVWVSIEVKLHYVFVLAKRGVE